MSDKINRNKGFEAMIPKPKEEKLPDHKIKLKLFGRTFNFSFSVTK